MYGKKKINVVLGLICLLLCGCTRREQLTESEDPALLALDTLESADAAREASLDGGDGRTEDGTAVPAGTEPGEAVAEPAKTADGPQTIYVHVCGAVKVPDVYALPAGSRVYEAVRAAGGFTEEADMSYVNQAQKLSDGVKLSIPTLEQTAELASQPAGSAAAGIAGVETPQAEAGSEADGVVPADQAADDRIDINTASEAQLCAIPGIGETRAAAIVAYRQENGGFRSTEEIMNVSGIKEGTYAKIREFITVSGN